MRNTRQLRLSQPFREPHPAVARFQAHAVDLDALRQDPMGSTRTPRRSEIKRRSLLVADVIALSSSFAIATLAGLGSSGSPLLRAGTLGLVILCGTLLGSGYGLYSRDLERVHHTTADDLVPVLHVMLTVTWVVAIAFWLGTGELDLEALLDFLATSTVLLALGRALARTWHRHRGDHLQNTLILGAGWVGQLVATKLKRRPAHGLNVVGFVDDDPPEIGPQLAHVPVLGPLEDLSALIAAWSIERVIVAFSVQTHERTEQLLRSLKGLDVQIDVVPRLFDVFGPHAEIHTIEGLPLIGHPRRHRSRADEHIKRTIDLVFATIGLVVCAPLLLVLALVVKLDSSGPAIYSAERVGRAGRPFRQLKFRTMYASLCDGPKYGGDDAETAFAVLLAGNDALREQYERAHKLDRDPRVTRVGRVLRATSLDELPQLWNVVRGELSLVGPRPITEAELPRYGAEVTDLLSVRPGLTGYWQINGRSTLGYEERVRLDLAYVQGWSLTLDLVILLRTTNVLTDRAGAL
jgi:exopolysaccharide biosynthesis polyprenyl glycosylphosphotransferase